MNRLDTIANALAVISALLGGIAMALMMVQVSLDVLFKYLFSQPIPFTLETVSSYYMVAIVFLPLGIVTRDRDLIAVDLFTQGLSKRRLALVNGLAWLLAAVYVGTLTYESGIEAIEKTIIRESWEAATLDMQVWPARWFIPIGCGVALIYFVLHAIDDLICAVTGRHTLARNDTVAPLEID